MMKYIFPLCLLTLPTIGIASSLESALIACKIITDNRQRLVCFDNIQMTPSKSASAGIVTEAETSAIKSTPVASVAPVKTQTVLTENDFGLEHKSQVKEQLQPSVSTVLKKINTTPLGLQIFSFENGQIWRQVSKEYFNAKVGKTYILERGALNSFFLSEEGKGRKTRVRRDK